MALCTIAANLETISLCHLTYHLTTKDTDDTSDENYFSNIPMIIFLGACIFINGIFNCVVTFSHIRSLRPN